MYKKKNEPQVKISKKLLSCLIYYHLLGHTDNSEVNAFIAAELNDKTDRVAAHEMYTKKILDRKET